MPNYVHVVTKILRPIAYLKHLQTNKNRFRNFLIFIFLNKFPSSYIVVVVLIVIHTLYACTFTVNARWIYHM